MYYVQNYYLVSFEVYRSPPYHCGACACAQIMQITGVHLSRYITQQIQCILWNIHSNFSLHHLAGT